MAKRRIRIVPIIIALVVLAGIGVGVYYITDHFTNWHLNVDCIAGNHVWNKDGVCVSCGRQQPTVLTLSAREIVHDTFFEGQNATYQLTAKITPDKTIKNEIIWTTSNASVATVEDNGLLRIVGIGTATVTAQATANKDLHETCKITVNSDNVPLTVSFVQDKIYLDRSVLDQKFSWREQRLVIAEQSGKQFTAGDFAWSISGDECLSYILPVESKTLQGHKYFKFYPITEGTCTITATCPNGASATATVYVGPRLNINYDVLSDAQVGQIYNLSATFLPEQLPGETLLAESSNKNVATIERGAIPTEFTISVMGYGSTTITFYIHYDGFKSEMSTYDLAIADAQHILLSWDRFDPTDNIVHLSTNATDEAALFYPQAMHLHASIIPESAPQELAWSSSDNTVVTVDDQGNIAAVGNGTATIRATAHNGVNTTCTVQVDTLAESISITDTSTLFLDVEKSVCIDAKVLPENATIWNQITWTSLDTSVATVDADGMVYGVSVGATQIRAGIGSGKTAVSNVEVVVPIESMHLTLDEFWNNGITDLTNYAGDTPEYKYSLAFDEVVKLNCRITPLDATDSGVTYESSDPDVVAYVGNGQIKGTGLGKATITATVNNGVSASVEVICTGRNGHDLWKDSLTLARGEVGSPFNDLAQQLIIEEYIRGGKIGNYDKIVGDGYWFEYAWGGGFFSVDAVTGNITGLAAGETVLSIIVYDFIHCNLDEELVTFEVLITILDLPGVLQEASWADIQAMAQDGTAKQYFKIGDEKTVTLTDGTELTFVLLDYDHDVENSVTFGLKDVLSAKSAMNTSNSNTAQTVMQEMLASGDQLLPEDLKAVIRTVAKQTSAGGKSRTIKTTNDKLFLFSEIEVFGSATGSFAGEGSQYAYFANAANRIKDVKWLLRSPSKDSYTNFRAVYESGNVGSVAANVECGVCFGFCV